MRVEAVKDEKEKNLFVCFTHLPIQVRRQFYKVNPNLNSSKEVLTLGIQHSLQFAVIQSAS